CDPLDAERTRQTRERRQTGTRTALTSCLHGRGNFSTEEEEAFHRSRERAGPRGGVVRKIGQEQAVGHIATLLVRSSGEKRLDFAPQVIPSSIREAGPVRGLVG